MLKDCFRKSATGKSESLLKYSCSAILEQGLPKQKILNIFYFYQKRESVQTKIGMVNFAKTHFVLIGLNWVCLATHVQALRLDSNHFSVLSCSSLQSGLFKANLHPKQPTKTKSIQFLKTTMCGLGRVFVVTASSVKGCLNTPRLFSLGGELHLSFFLFLFEKIATKPLTFFNSLRIKEMFNPI